jgi:NAD(P)H dehydrogenase (quinone)
MMPGLSAAAGSVDDSLSSVTLINADRAGADTGSGASYYPVSGVIHSPGFSDGNSPKALIIHADPATDNLVAAARDYMAGYLVSDGWDVAVRSLYEDHFDPLAGETRLSYTAPPTAASNPDVSEYQKLIREADALILVYPLWWKQPPAMLKGWQDRVFSYGFAYEFVDGVQESVVSLLPGKKLLIINVVAGSRKMYEELGYLRYLNFADRTLFGASGMEFSGRHIIYSATDIGLDEKTRCLEELADLAGFL